MDTDKNHRIDKGNYKATRNGPVEVSEYRLNNQWTTKLPTETSIGNDLVAKEDRRKPSGESRMSSELGNSGATS